MGRIKYSKLSRDKPEKTTIVAGNEQISIEDLEKKSSQIKKKLTSLEESLENLLILIFIALY